MTNYVILLPPSEGKKLSVNGIKKDNWLNEISFQELNQFREEVYSKLYEFVNGFDDIKLQKIFDSKGKRLEEAKNFTNNLKSDLCLRAIERFDGVMFKSINYLNMNENLKKNFNLSVLFIDGLFGLLKPNDLIHNYKLKVAAKLGDFNITQFWKKNLKEILNRELKNKFIIDILPQAHRKVIDYSNLNYISITFGEIRNGKFKQAGHASKVLKGEIINYIVSFDNLTRGNLENFTHSDGYKYNSDLSDENKIVYLKN